jgi:hypothetical protein
MQTIKRMGQSGSMHFSNTNSYTILFISSYELKDMNLASFKHLQQFSEKQKIEETFSHRAGPSQEE